MAGRRRLEARGGAADNGWVHDTCAAASSTWRAASGTRGGGGDGLARAWLGYVEVCARALGSYPRICLHGRGVHRRRRQGRANAACPQDGEAVRGAQVQPCEAVEAASFAADAGPVLPLGARPEQQQRADVDLPRPAPGGRAATEARGAPAEAVEAAGGRGGAAAGGGTEPPPPPRLLGRTNDDRRPTNQ